MSLNFHIFESAWNYRIRSLEVSTIGVIIDGISDHNLFSTQFKSLLNYQKKIIQLSKTSIFLLIDTSFQDFWQYRQYFEDSHYNVYSIFLKDSFFLQYFDNYDDTIFFNDEFYYLFVETSAKLPIFPKSSYTKISSKNTPRYIYKFESYTDLLDTYSILIENRSNWPIFSISNLINDSIQGQKKLYEIQYKNLTISKAKFHQFNPDNFLHYVSFIDEDAQKSKRLKNVERIFSISDIKDVQIGVFFQNSIRTFLGFDNEFRCLHVFDYLKYLEEKFNCFIDVTLFEKEKMANFKVNFGFYYIEIPSFEKVTNFDCSIVYSIDYDDFVHMNSSDFIGFADQNSFEFALNFLSSSLSNNQFLLGDVTKIEVNDFEKMFEENMSNRLTMSKLFYLLFAVKNCEVKMLNFCLKEAKFFEKNVAIKNKNENEFVLVGFVTYDEREKAFLSLIKFMSGIRCFFPVNETSYSVFDADDSLPKIDTNNLKQEINEEKNVIEQVGPNIFGNDEDPDAFPSVLFSDPNYQIFQPPQKVEQPIWPQNGHVNQFVPITELNGHISQIQQMNQFMPMTEINLQNQAKTQMAMQNHANAQYIVQNQTNPQTSMQNQANQLPEQKAPIMQNQLSTKQPEQKITTKQNEPSQTSKKLPEQKNSSKQSQQNQANQSVNQNKNKQNENEQTGQNKIPISQNKQVSVQINKNSKNQQTKLQIDQNKQNQQAKNSPAQNQQVKVTNNQIKQTNQSDKKPLIDQNNQNKKNQQNKSSEKAKPPIDQTKSNQQNKNSAEQNKQKQQNSTDQNKQTNSQSNQSKQTIQTDKKTPTNQNKSNQQKQQNSTDQNKQTKSQSNQPKQPTQTDKKPPTDQNKQKQQNPTDQNKQANFQSNQSKQTTQTDKKTSTNQNKSNQQKPQNTADQNKQTKSQSSQSNTKSPTEQSSPSKPPADQNNQTKPPPNQTAKKPSTEQHNQSKNSTEKPPETVQPKQDSTKPQPPPTAPTIQSKNDTQLKPKKPLGPDYFSPNQNLIYIYFIEKEKARKISPGKQVKLTLFGVKKCKDVQRYKKVPDDSEDGYFTFFGFEKFDEAETALKLIKSKWLSENTIEFYESTSAYLKHKENPDTDEDSEFNQEFLLQAINDKKQTIQNQQKNEKVNTIKTVKINIFRDINTQSIQYFCVSQLSIPTNIQYEIKMTLNKVKTVKNIIRDVVPHDLIYQPCTFVFVDVKDQLNENIFKNVFSKYKIGYTDLPHQLVHGKINYVEFEEIYFPPDKIVPFLHFLSLANEVNEIRRNTFHKGLIVTVILFDSSNEDYVMDLIENFMIEEDIIIDTKKFSVKSSILFKEEVMLQKKEDFDIIVNEIISFGINPIHIERNKLLFNRSMVNNCCFHKFSFICFNNKEEKMKALNHVNSILFTGRENYVRYKPDLYYIKCDPWRYPLKDFPFNNSYIFNIFTRILNHVVDYQENVISIEHPIELTYIGFESKKLMYFYNSLLFSRIIYANVFDDSVFFRPDEDLFYIKFAFTNKEDKLEDYFNDDVVLKIAQGQFDCIDFQEIGSVNFNYVGFNSSNDREFVLNQMKSFDEVNPNKLKFEPFNLVEEFDDLDELTSENILTTAFYHMPFQL